MRWTFAMVAESVTPQRARSGLEQVACHPIGSLAVDFHRFLPSFSNPNACSSENLSAASVSVQNSERTLKGNGLLYERDATIVGKL
jgi:hypothetical protein